jgi:hypothetical protein
MVAKHGDEEEYNDTTILGHPSVMITIVVVMVENPEIDLTGLYI